MSSKEKLADQIRANVARAGESESKKRPTGTGLPKSSNSSAYVAPHRHCTVCQIPIKLKRDPPVCGEKKCGDEWESRERQRKRWNLLLYLAPAIMVTALLLSNVMGS